MAAFLKKLAGSSARVLQSFPTRFSTKVRKASREFALREAAVRHGSDARKVNVTPSRYTFNRFKNDMHFYTMLGIVPLGSVILYSNLIVGESELAEIPEGYEPKHWEYYKHPIQRWFARNVYRNPAKSYELFACKVVTEFEEIRERRFIKKAKDLMMRDDDYRAYYFVPAVDPRPVEKMQKFHDERPSTYGTG